MPWDGPWTSVTGVIVTAAQLNQTRDNLNELRAGGLAISGQVANDVIIASSSTQLGRTTTLPTAVQDNITRLGTIATNFTTNGNAIVAGTLRVDNNATIGDAASDAHTINGSLTTAGARFVTATISPAALTGTVNDYAPSGFSTCAVLRVAADGTDVRTITGLAGGAAGRTVILANVGAAAIELTTEAAASSAANRFAGAAESTISIGRDRHVTLWYDGTSSRWRVSL
jgi:hypothetical protein